MNVKRLVKVLGLFIVVFVLLYFYRQEVTPKMQTTRAFGELKADFGVARKTPAFHSISIAAGESEAKRIVVANEGTQTKLVFFRGVHEIRYKRTESHDDVLDIRIEDETQSLYGRGSTTGNKTVKDFFADSGSAYGIPLAKIQAGKTKTYFIIVSNPEKVDAESKKETLIFDLTIDGISI